MTMFDCLHDMGDPVGAARHVRGTLTPDGTWMIVEPKAGDRVEENLNPVGRAYYGVLHPAVHARRRCPRRSGWRSAPRPARRGSGTSSPRPASPGSAGSPRPRSTSCSRPGRNCAPRRYRSTSRRLPGPRAGCGSTSRRTGPASRRPAAPDLEDRPLPDLEVQIPYLARHGRVVTFDPRGNGRSDRPAESAAYDRREFAADALAVLDAVGADARPCSWRGALAARNSCCWPRGIRSGWPPRC